MLSAEISKINFFTCSRYPFFDGGSSGDCAALAFKVKTWNHIGWEFAMAAMEKTDSKPRRSGD